MGEYYIELSSSLRNMSPYHEMARAMETGREDITTLLQNIKHIPFVKYNVKNDGTYVVDARSRKRN